MIDCLFFQSGFKRNLRSGQSFGYGTSVFGGLGLFLEFGLIDIRNDRIAYHGLVSFTAGIVFWLMGAWPVFGFLGLDVLLIYLAFRFNYRSARAYETIEINGEQLILTRSDPAGRKKRFEFNPYWVRVLLSERNDGRTSLALTSHGQVIEFGRFLNDDERREFASALKYALSTVRAAPSVG